MAKVLISDKMSSAAEEIFKKNNIEVDYKPGLSADELMQIIADYDGLAIRSATRVTKEILEKATNLKVVGRAGIGVDNVDLQAATDRGVIVMNTPFGNSITTAEHAIAMMFALAREIPQANESTHAGKWEKSKFMGTEITGKTLGVIGCGNIGSIVAKRAKGLAMKVVAFDPFLTNEKADDLAIEKVELDELFSRSDFITLHVPLNDKTKDIISNASFSKMKKGVFIINCARGGLVNEEDLKVALDSGQVAGAALDVFANEPAKTNILFGNDKVVCTPHLGASTKEAQENVALQVAEQISNFFNYQTIENSINIPALSKEDATRIAPYLKLSQCLGSFAGQLTENPIKEIKITYYGQVTDSNTKPLTLAIVNEVLATICEGVNIVNSMSIAKQRGIKVTSANSSSEAEYQNYIEVELLTEKQRRTVTGTLFANEPRIVKINGVHLEVGLSPYMIFVKNEDKPGLIGELGTLLAKEKINIANFHLGRNPNKQGMAIALIAVDSDVSSKVIAAINEMASVTQAKFLTF